MENKQGLLYLVPRATYYNTKEDVVREAEKAHAETMKEDRELYTYLLYFLNSTYYSKGLIIERLLSNSLHKPENAPLLQKDERLLAIEDALIHRALMNENVTHALKLLLSLKKKRVNNSRTSKVILRFLFDRGNLDYIAIKYKAKVKELLFHALGAKTVHSISRHDEEGADKYERMVKVYNNPYALELFSFIFNKDVGYRSPYFAEYTKVREMFMKGTVNLDTQTSLPIEVLEGFNNFYKRGLNIPSLLKVAVVSEKQVIQMQNTVKRQSDDKVELKVDFSRYGALDLYKYLYSKKDLSLGERHEIRHYLKERAAESRRSIEKHFEIGEDVAIIVDFSDSHRGDKTANLNPFYKNLILADIFVTEDGSNMFPVGGEIVDGEIVPEGETDLSKALIRAVKAGFERFIVLSDGYENVGNFDEVLHALKRVGHENLSGMHFNPVFSPKDFSFKTISPSVPSIPFVDEKDFENMPWYYMMQFDPEEFKRRMREKILAELLQEEKEEI